MGLVSVNYSLNQTYFVSTEAFVDAVKKATKKAKLTKTNEIEVKYITESNDFRVFIKALIKKGTSIKKALLELQCRIEEISLNLIDSKPENILIDIEGEF